MTEYERMKAGKVCMQPRMQFSNDEGMKAERRRQKKFAQYREMAHQDMKAAGELLKEALGGCGEGSFIEPTDLIIDFPGNLYLGDHCYINHRCTILCPGEVRMGNGVAVAPNVSIYTLTHAMHPALRNRGGMVGRPITIGDNVWICGNAVLCPGVTIGEGSVIGPGSVVTRDVPPMVFVGGNPAKVIRPITDEDYNYWKAMKDDYDADPDVNFVENMTLAEMVARSKAILEEE